MFVSHLRITMATGIIGGLLALGAPAAIAKQSMTDSNVSVCNQATPTSLGGTLVALDDPAAGGSSARYTSGLTAMPGHGAGLVRAAANSPALTLCGEPPVGDPPVVYIS